MMAFWLLALSELLPERLGDRLAQWVTRNWP